MGIACGCLFRFVANSIGVHTRDWKPGQRPITDVWLNKHVVKHLCLYSQMSDALSLGQKNFCLQWVTVNECGDAQLLKVLRESDV